METTVSTVGEPDRLVSLYGRRVNQAPGETISLPDLEDARALTSVFEDASAYFLLLPASVRDAIGNALLVLSFGGQAFSVSADKQMPRDSGRDVIAQFSKVDQYYLATMGIRLLAGDGNLTRRGGAGFQPAIVIETLARKLWPDRGPIGELLRIPQKIVASWVWPPIPSDAIWAKRPRHSRITPAGTYL